MNKVLLTATLSTLALYTPAVITMPGTDPAAQPPPAAAPQPAPAPLPAPQQAPAPTPTPPAPAAAPAPTPVPEQPAPQPTPPPAQPAAPAPQPEQVPAPTPVPEQPAPQPTPPPAQPAAPAPQPEQVPAPTPAPEQPTPPPATEAMPVISSETPAPAPAAEQPAPTPEPAPQPASPEASAPKASVSSQDIEQMNGYLNAINTAKDELKQLLSRIDDEVGKAKTAAAQVRKRSMEILSQKDDAAAKAIADEITNTSNTLKKTYDDLNSTVSSTFQSGISNIQTTINTMQEALKALKAQGVAFQASLPSEPQQGAVTQTTGASGERNWIIADNTKTQKAEDKTIVHYVFNKIADLVSEAARFAYATYTGVKEAWFKSEPAKPSLDHSAAPAKMPPALPTSTPTT